MPNTRYIDILIQQCLDGTATKETRSTLLHLLKYTDDPAIEEKIVAAFSKDQIRHEPSAIVWQQISNQTVQLKKENNPILRRLVYGWGKYAAVFAIVIGFTIWAIKFDWTKGKDSVNVTNNFAKDDILLSNDHSTVALDNGQEISITDTTSSFISDKVEIRKLSPGVFSFKVKSKTEEGEVFQKFSTPKGVSNQIVLNDGTRVYLNSSSEISISSKYGISGSRNVNLEGEAYFEVKHDISSPFIVRSKGTNIRVLGTEFNVKTNGFGSGVIEDLVVATLKSGSIRFSNRNSSALLSPGEQGISKNNSSMERRKANIDEILSWKEGYFIFEDKPLLEILENISTWYDIESIDWQKKSNSHLTFSVKRTKSLSKLLRQMEKISDVKFEINGRRLIVK